MSLFLLLHSRAGFWEGCDLEYVSSPPGGWREGWKYSQDALPDGQSLRYYRVALCRLCVLAECPRVAHVFVIREIRPRAAVTPLGLLSEGTDVGCTPGWVIQQKTRPAHRTIFGQSAGTSGDFLLMSRYCLIPWGFGASDLDTVESFWGRDTQDNSPDVSERVSLPGPFKLDSFMFSFPVVCNTLVPLTVTSVWFLVPCSALCVLTLPASLSQSLGLEHKLLTGHA